MAPLGLGAGETFLPIAGGEGVLGQPQAAPTMGCIGGDKKKVAYKAMAPGCNLENTWRWSMVVFWGIWLACLLFGSLGVGWHIHTRVTGGPDRSWSGRAAAVLVVPALAVYAVTVLVG